MNLTMIVYYLLISFFCVGARCSMRRQKILFFFVRCLIFHHTNTHTLLPKHIDSSSCLEILIMSERARSVEEDIADKQWVEIQKTVKISYLLIFPRDSVSSLHLSVYLTNYDLFCVFYTK
jgi:hypothetical protein